MAEPGFKWASSWLPVVQGGRTQAKATWLWKPEFPSVGDQPGMRLYLRLLTLPNTSTLSLIQSLLVSTWCHLAVSGPSFLPRRSHLWASTHWKRPCRHDRGCLIYLHQPGNIEPEILDVFSSSFPTFLFFSCVETNAQRRALACRHFVCKGFILDGLLVFIQ